MSLLIMALSNDKVYLRLLSEPIISGNPPTNKYLSKARNSNASSLVVLPTVFILFIVQYSKNENGYSSIWL